MKTMRILLLEDHPVTQKLISLRLTGLGHHVDTFDNGHQGFRVATSDAYDVIISDIQMPHWDGFKFIEAMEVVAPRLPIVIITGSEKEEAVQQRLVNASNVVATLRKPVDFDALFQVLQRIRLMGHLRLSKKARIVATIGPASASEDILGRMMLAGMDVARLNFSHGSHQQHEQTLTAIRAAESKWEKPVAVLVDLCGPKIRTGLMKDGEITLLPGHEIIVSANEVEGTAEKISTIAPEVLKDLKPGEPILLDDGLLELRVVQTDGKDILCEVIVGGKLRSHKGMNLPETVLSVPSITEKDWRDLQWAIDHDVDYVALSFVRSSEEIHTIKRHIEKSKSPGLRVIAKIEKPEAIRHISEIIAATDAIMIARGDMGVEIPAARVPRVQQKIIELCWQANTPVITATQMLESMTINARPTRAEVTDVSVAIREGTDAVMLSGETATGIDPVNVVRTMAAIIYEEERHGKEPQSPESALLEDTAINPILTATAALSSTKATILLDPEGILYPALSKWSRTVPTILVTQSRQAARHACLFRNISPLIISDGQNRSDLIYHALERVRQEGYVRPGNIVALVEGEYLTDRNIQQIGTLQLLVV